MTLYYFHQLKIMFLYNLITLNHITQEIIFKQAMDISFGNLNHQIIFSILILFSFTLYLLFKIDCIIFLWIVL